MRLKPGAVYAPRPGCVADQAIAILRRGPVRQTRLAELLGVDRRTLYMGMIVPIRMGLVEKVRGRCEGEPGVEALYQLTSGELDEDERPMRRAEAGYGPSAEAIAAANPFGLVYQPMEALQQ